MIYLIENKILFNPEDNTLSLQNDPENQVSISNPARRVLLLLIEQQGTVVQRDILFKKVWDDYGLVSSNNNLNHCISKLRKVINTLGHTDDVIITVPKVGFLLKKEITISAIDATGSINSVEEESDKIVTPPAIEVPQKSVVTPAMEYPQDVLTPGMACEMTDESLVMPAVVTPAAVVTPKVTRDFTLPIFIASLFTLALALGLLLHEHIYDPKENLEVTTLGQCALYSTTRLPANQRADFIDRAEKFIAQKKIICQPGNIFIFQSETLVSLISSGSTRDFMAECRVDDKNNPTACLSVYSNNRTSNDKK
ncbi:winged helix-turn-helix domain-containing protein [Ewingella americana]|uniref:winged helix-turn-helix domain-containing protein n=1 Tax=Ewingella americana TaxID=41202 RepID=UPI001639CFE3|nr:winged helix-turn-helix domain-containing protein [Ewingella americana]QMV53303.1 CadC family transcriptional regulator [Ewingella americana]